MNDELFGPDEECGGGRCRRDRETGTLILCDLHEHDALAAEQEENGSHEYHAPGCVCIDCHHQPGDVIAENE